MAFLLASENHRELPALVFCLICMLHNAQVSGTMMRIGLISACFTIYHLLLAIPFNLMSILTIAKSPQLWTQINAVLVANSIIQLCSSLLVCVTGWGALAKELDGQSIDDDLWYEAFWLVTASSIRSGFNW